jgi:Disulphide bond corrector protein DsbC
MKKLLFVFLGVSSVFGANPTAPKFLTVETPKVVSVRSGRTAETFITVKIDPEFHIQANPASQKNLIPTTIEFPATEGVVMDSITYPEGTTFRLENSDRDMMVYGGEVKFKVKFQAKTVKLGKVDLVGTLRYQPCNQHTCFFPNRYELKIPVQVLK